MTRAVDDVLHDAGERCMLTGDEAKLLHTELHTLRAENTRIRAALALSDRPCIYCALPADEWAKCEDGFPGCARGDDGVGCPHLGDGLELAEVRAERDALRAAVRDAELQIFVHSRSDWNSKHAAVIARAREAGK